MNDDSVQIVVSADLGYHDEDQNGANVTQTVTVTGRSFMTLATILLIITGIVAVVLSTPAISKYVLTKFAMSKHRRRFRPKASVDGLSSKQPLEKPTQRPRFTMDIAHTAAGRCQQRTRPARSVVEHVQ